MKAFEQRSARHPAVAPDLIQIALRDRLAGIQQYERIADAFRRIETGITATFYI
jgi:hypothetical protein